MPLSRLENFLKNVEGNILYVNPTDLDATDSIENQGNSLTRPFKTIQRALIEAARFSYQIGQNNDKFDRTTILLYPGTHEIDNRPGFNITQSGSSAVFRDRNGNVQTLSQLTDTSNYNLDDSANDLYKYNSVEGGVIIPRGTSIVGLDLRKTKVRPKFVPNPESASVSPSAIFRLTGGCYLWQFSIFDGDPKGSVYKDYTANRFVPNFSHHKLTAFEYADGVNNVGVGTSSLVSTDLDMYFQKVQRAYGTSSGREIGDFPGTTDMQPKLPEFEIVGPVSTNDVGISSIRAGAGSKTNTSTTITVDCETAHGVVVDSAIRISGVTTYPDIYNGNFIVTGVSSERIFTYQASSAPLDGLPTLNGNEVVIADTDTVSGASPYVFNISMRSVYGMSGIHADGSKAHGFKSMVVAQFTGISLQKDNNAFLLYNPTTGQYDTNATAASGDKPLYLNSESIYRPSYENYHIKASNEAFLQNVSIFAIGYANHFLGESGGDMSITNSNSNFGSRSLIAKGHRNSAFDRDNRGYITHVVAPQSIVKDNKSVEWLPLNVGLTTAPVGVGTTAKLFLDGFVDPDIPPTHVIDGYRIGATYENNEVDHLYLTISGTSGVGTFRTPIKMENFDGTEGSIGAKEYYVGRVGTANSVSTNIFTLTSDHKLFAGESVRVYSDDGHLPDGLESNTIYYAVTNESQNETLNADQIKLARSQNEALLGGSGNFLTINNNTGGILQIVSRVSDKRPGDSGHPIQYDTLNSNWYVRGGISTSENQLWQEVVNNQVTLFPRTVKTFIQRKEDTRSLTDKIYRLRYVIPKESSDAKPPAPGFIIQESSTVGVSDSTEFTNNISNVTIQRNVRILKSIDRDSNTGVTTVVTEKPHNLLIGDEVTFTNVKSSGNTVGAAKSGFNIQRTISGITSSKGFEVTFPVTSPNPGTFVDNVSIRNEDLPTVARTSYFNTPIIYRVETLKTHEHNKQDGVYYLTCIDGSISPTVNEFTDTKFHMSVEDLYPQFDADNFTMDPDESASFAANTPIGRVVTNDLKKSLTKEFTNTFLVDNKIGYAITGAISSSSGISTVFTNAPHNFNTIISLGTPTAGSGYGPGVSTTLYNVSLTGGSGEGATANVTVSASQTVTGLSIVDGGTAYAAGDTLTIDAGNADATVSVSKINDNIGDAIQVVGVGTSISRYTSGYVGVHTITGLTAKSVSYNTGSNAGVYVPTTVGVHTGFFMLSGDVSNVTAISYSNKKTGIVTVTTNVPHGLNVNNKFKIVGVAQTIYNGEFQVNERLDIKNFNFKITEGFDTDAYVSGGQVLPIFYGAKGGLTQSGNERISQRHIPFSVGIGTTLAAAGITTTNTTLTLDDSSGFYKGDYIQIDGEILRIASDFTSDEATVLRGQLGTRATNHDGSSIAKKIRVIANENRRYTILRASGHTFEYIGFGPGNYSTALPQKQARNLTREENFLSQSRVEDGGSVVYTGMNDAGDFYIGNRRVSSLDGTESTFNIPIPTVTGSDSSNTGSVGRLDAIFDTVTVRESLTVNGNNNGTVKLNAPIQITEKLTSSSPDGIEVVSIDITGGLTQARTITYSDTAPIVSGVEGDIIYNANPESGGYLGWVFTDAGWKRFGLISTEFNETQVSLFTVGVGSTSAARIGDQNGIDVRGQTVTDNLLVTGIATFQSNVTFDSVSFQDIFVSRAATIGANGTLTVLGFSTFHDVFVGGGLTVTEATDLNGDLDVGGRTSLDDTDIDGNLTISGIVTITDTTQSHNKDTGSLILEGGLGVEKNTNVGGNFQVTGIGTILGNITLGDSSADELTINAQIDSDLIPNTDATFDVGAASSQWRNGSFSGIVTATTFDGMATKVGVGSTDRDSTHFVTLVDSNNNTQSEEFLRTDPNLQFNPSTNELSIVNNAGVTTGIVRAGVGSFTSLDGGLTTRAINGTQIGGFKNLLRNGAHVVHQRNHSASAAWVNGNRVGAQTLTLSAGDVTGTNAQYTATADQAYITDGWYMGFNGGGTMTCSQQRDSAGLAELGLFHCLRAEVTAADASQDANDYAYLGQRIESTNTPQLAWGLGIGTAKSVTVSFWVRANPGAGGSVTGVGNTYSVSLFNGWELNPGGGAQPNYRGISKGFTIDADNTWEYKTLTFDGCPDGPWNKNHKSGVSAPADGTGSLNRALVGLEVRWNLNGGTNGTIAPDTWSQATPKGVNGQTNFMETVGSWFEITGCQLEVGTQATAFEHVDYCWELQRCMRYYQVFQNFGSQFATTGNTNEKDVVFQQKFMGPSNRYYDIDAAAWMPEIVGFTTNWAPTFEKGILLFGGSSGVTNHYALEMAPDHFRTQFAGYANAVDTAPYLYDIHISNEIPWS